MKSYLGIYRAGIISTNHYIIYKDPVFNHIRMTHGMSQGGNFERYLNLLNINFLFASRKNGSAENQPSGPSFLVLVFSGSERSTILVVRTSCALRGLSTSGRKSCGRYKTNMAQNNWTANDQFWMLFSFGTQIWNYSQMSHQTKKLTLHPWKLTWLAEKASIWVNVSPIEKWRFSSDRHVNFWGVCIILFDGRHLANHLGWLKPYK